MLLQPMSSKKNLWKYLAALPLLALVVFACQQEAVVAPESKMTKPDELVAATDTTVTFNPETKEWIVTSVNSEGEKMSEAIKSTITVDEKELDVTPNEGDYSVDTIIMFNPETYEETMSLVKTPFYRSCLLYTSPSPRDQRGSRMPSSA